MTESLPWPFVCALVDLIDSSRNFENYVIILSRPLPGHMFFVVGFWKQVTKLDQVPVHRFAKSISGVRWRGGSALLRGTHVFCSWAETIMMLLSMLEKLTNGQDSTRR